jgi:HEAT repeat protein
MPSWSLNSKKCSTLNAPPITLFWAFACASSALSLNASSTWAALPQTTQVNDLRSLLQKDLGTRTGLTFERILKNWESRYGTRAVQPLLGLASDSKLTDPDRYLALMGAAKLGGSEIAPKLTSLLSDPSWMIRSGALRAISALNHPATSSSVLALLRDPALIVRVEAVEAATRLRPPGVKEALLQTLEDSANYHQGKAQWVPSRALAALVKLGARDAAPRLMPLLSRSSDPKLQRQTVEALESLTGRKMATQGSISLKIEAWKKFLAQSQSVPASGS